MQDVICEVLPIVEGLIEPKVEDFLQDFLSESSLVQVSSKVGKWCSLEKVLGMT